MLWFILFVVPLLVMVGVAALLVRFFLRRKKDPVPLAVWALVPAAILAIVSAVVLAVPSASAVALSLLHLYLPGICLLVGLCTYIVVWAVMTLVRTLFRRWRGLPGRRGDLVAAVFAFVLLVAVVWGGYGFLHGLYGAREAASPSLSESRAYELYESASANWDAPLLEDLARNPKTPAPILQRILDLMKTRGLRSGSGEGMVLCRLAANVGAPPEILTALAVNERWDVRAAVATNPNTPIDLLETLSRDPDELIRKYLCNNPRVPIGILTRLKSDQDPDVRSSAKAALDRRGVSDDNAK